MATQGQQEYQRLQDAGFTAQELSQWQAQQTQKLRGAGFSEQEVAKYWGDGQPNTPELDNLVKQNVGNNWMPEGARVADPNSWVDMFQAGWDMSVTGLTLHKPGVVAPENAGFFHRLAQDVGQFTGDLPTAIVGTFAGAAGGAAATAETGPGAIVGGIVGGGIGSAAIPEAARQVKIDYYRNGELLTSQDFAHRVAHITWETTKAGSVGGLSALVGGRVGAKVLERTGSAGWSMASNALGYSATATSASAALDGRMPDADSFLRSLVMLGGFHVGMKLYTAVGQGRIVPTAAGDEIVRNMQDIYVKTGVPPWDQAEKAAHDPAYRQEVFARDGNDNPTYSYFKSTGPEEPAPYKPRNTNAHAVQDEHDAEVRNLETEAFKHFGEKPEERLDLIDKLERSGAFAKSHGISVDDVVSGAGAVGRYQVTPDTARTYGFDPARLKDPEYNRKAASAILDDLAKRYRKADGTVDLEAVLIAYNAGPGRANSFRANGRNFNKLPLETQRYLERAQRLGAFDNEPPAGGAGGGGGEPPKQIGGPGAEPFDLNPEMLTEKINEAIANPVASKSPMKWVKDALERFKFEAVSELTPAERLDKALGVKEDDFGIADSFRQVYGSTGRAWHMLEKGAVDPVTFEKTSDAALLPAYREASKLGSIDEFKAWRQAKRTVELAATGRDTTVDMNVAQTMIEKIGDKYNGVMRTVRAANDAKIDYYQQSGMLSAEGAKTLKANNRDWFPQIVAKEGEAGARQGSRFGPKQVIKKAEGHERLILDPMTQEIKSYYSTAAIADKNRAVLALKNALKPEDMKDLGIKLLPDKTAKMEIFDKDGNLVPEAMDNTGPFKLDGNEIAYYENGVRKVMEVDDPQLAEMVRGMSPIKPDQTLGVLRWFAALKRSGITDMPDFIARAMAKDATGAAILSKWGGVPFVNTFRGLVHLSKADPIFQEFVRNGGFGAALSDMDANYVTRNIHSLDVETGAISRVVNTVKYPLEAAQLVMQRMDMATRLGIYQRAKASGLPTFKAGIEARRGTLDFQEKAAGTTANILAGITPFFRPSILGLKQTAEAFTKRPLQTGAKSLVYIALPTAAFYALNTLQDEGLPEDRKFKNLPRWQKDTMFILPEIAGVRVRLPMPPLLGTLVGGMTNRMLDYFAEQDPRAFKQWASDLLEQFIPPMMPAAIAPLAEHMANYNSFLGRPLIPSYLEEASDYMQYTPNTSETAKKIAELLGPPSLNVVGISPIVIDNYVRQWTGAMGTAVLKAVDGFAKDDGRPYDIANNPFVGSFFVRHPGTSAQPITDFYDAADAFTAKHRDLALALQQQDMDLVKFDASMVQSFISLDQTKQALSNMRNTIYAITSNKDMTQDEKRQYIDSLYTGMIQVANQGLAITDSVQ